MKKNIFFLLIFLVLAVPVSAQYEIDPQVIELDDMIYTAETIDLYIPNERENVKSIGMGKTQVSNGKFFDAMMNNPAFLGNKKTSFEILSLQASLPPETYTAANYINDHIEEFKQALSLKEVWRGVKDFEQAQNLEQQIAAIKRIQSGLKFPRDLLQNVIGNSQNPTTHGIRILPAVSFQLGNFGFSAYAVGQSGFAVQQNPIVDYLLDVYIPDDLNNPQQVQQAIESIAGILQTIVEADGEIDTNVLPVTYSVSYIDIVGAAGYGMKLTPQLNVGANLKVMNRRFSAKRIVSADYNEILSVLKRDFDANITGFTMDIGGVFKFDFGLQLGLAVQNIIPFQEVTSTLQADIPISYYDYKRDQAGNIIINQNGDTVINAVSQNIDLRLPFDLELPILVNLGATFPITKFWDVSFELADIADQDSRYEFYEERLRLGTEYRLETSDKFGAAFRVGLAESRFTGGIGFNIFKALQIDGAYAYDPYVGSYSYYGQIRLGW
jgi:hypothetical protein